MADTLKSFDPWIYALRSSWAINQNFQILGDIASGSQGHIYLGRPQIEHIMKRKPLDPLNALVAIKSEKLSRGCDQPSVIMQEAEFLRMLRHPNIVRMLEIDTSSLGKDLLVLEYCNRQSLKELLKKKGKLSETISARYFKQLVGALEYTNQRAKILHNDVKPGNLLLHLNPHHSNVADDHDEPHLFYTLKLADFGISVRISDDRAQSKFNGTVPYMAPERLGNVVTHASLTAADVRGNSSQGDIWAAGAVLYEMVMGVLYWTALNASDHQNFWEQNPNITDPRLRKLIRAMLSDNPVNRPSWAEIQVNDWVEKYSKKARSQIKELMAQFRERDQR